MVDRIASFDLRDPLKFRLAHEIAEELAAADCPENGGDGDIREGIENIHLDLWRLLREAPVVQERIDQLAAERAARAAELHGRWSEHHEQKANCYPVKPVVCLPVKMEGLDPRSREVVE